MEKLGQALDPTTSQNVPLLLLVSIDQRWEKYRTELNCFRKDPSGDTVRALRVATRRLRTLLQLIDELHPYKSLERINRSYKGQLSDLDELRDTQVMLKEIASTLAQFPVLQAFQEEQQKREAKAMRKARKEFKQVEPGQTVKVLVKWMGRLKGRQTQDDPQKLMESIDASFQVVHQRFDQVDQADPATIHRVRLAFKKFRYKVEVLHPLVPDLPSDALKCLDTYQGWMGAVQDIQVLHGSLSDFAMEHPDLALEPVIQYYQLCLMDAVSKYMKHKDTLNDFWRPSPGQPFPWRQSNENIPAQTWNCDGA